MKSKIRITMFSIADKFNGQGVSSAYMDFLALFNNKEDLIIYTNKIGKTDISHLHSVDPISSFRFKKSRAIKVVTVHFVSGALDGAIKMPKLFHNLYNRFVNSVYKASDYLVVVNPLLKEPLTNIGIDEKKILFIPNYVNQNIFFTLSETEKEKIKKQYNIPKNRFVVLSIGQVLKRKGVLDFIETAKKMPDITFVWCGGLVFGKFTEHYKELKHIYDAPPKNVIFLGQVTKENMNLIYNIADVVFVPSHKETFGMVILESSILKKPAICRSLDVYDNLYGKNCLYGDNNDDFIKKIALLKNKDEYEKFQEKTTKLKKMYCKDNIYAMWLKFYTKINKKD